MSREARKLALEALENSIDLVEEDYANAVSLYGKYPSRAQRLIGMETMRDDHRKAITALREDLAKPDFWEGYVPEPVKPAQDVTLIDEGKTAQQEPVAYLCENAVGHKYFRWKKPSSTYKPIALYKSPPAQRTWQGLTEEERKLVRNSVGYNQFVTVGEYAEHVQKATEFKLLEKNT